MNRRRSRAALAALLAGVVVLAVVAFLVLGNRDTTAGGPSPRGPGDLTGEWSGDGTATRCAGFDRCSGTRPITLSIDCSGKRCLVVPFDRRYGNPPLRLSDGRYRAAGPLPPGGAPTCGGSPASTGLWRLELTVTGGRLTGSYAESTQQSFDCGATGVAWDVVLDRR